MDAIVDPHPSPVLDRLFRRRTGLSPAMVPYVAPHPWAYRPFLFLMNPKLEALDQHLCSQICFVVARDNACRFCYGSFRSFLRVAGYSTSELNRLEEELSLNGDHSAEHEALRFVVELSQGRLQAGTTPTDLHEAGYDETVIREIGGIAAVSTFINRVATMLAIPVNAEAESLTHQWYFELLQPVLRILLQGWQRIGTPDAPPLAAVDVDGPFSSWIERLVETCVGHVLHDLTTQWLQEETALPLRTKLFVLAVVARGLGSQALEEQAETLLIDRCNLSRQAVKAVVDHLRGRVVTEREEALLQLARESIRYEAGRIQPTVREHTQDLSRAETIDAVATLALSNALARLRALAPLDD